MKHAQEIHKKQTGKPFQFYLPEELRERLRKWCEKNDIPASQAVAQLIEKFLKGESK